MYLILYYFPHNKTALPFLKVSVKKIRILEDIREKSKT